jgi:hypothetical protein
MQNIADLFKKLADSDNDGLTDEQERKIGTNPNDADTDRDGLTDIYEYWSPNGLDPKKFDTDGDGLNDGHELYIGTKPAVKDSDGDGINDKQDLLPLDPTNGGNDPLPNKPVLFGAEASAAASDLLEPAEPVAASEPMAEPMSEPEPYVEESYAAVESAPAEMTADAPVEEMAFDA